MSLRWRVAALVTTLVAALLLVLGLVLGSGLHGWSERAVDETLDARAAEVVHAVHDEDGEAPELHELTEHAGSVLLRVARPGGAVLYASPGFPALSAAQATAPRATVTVGAERFRVRRATSSDGGLVLHLAAPLALLGAVERSFGGALFWALVLGALLGGVLSALLAHVALSPLRRLAAQVAALEPTAADQRVDTAGLPAELSPVVAAFNDLLARTASAFGRERAFVARASHALRTPVASTLVEAEVALRKERTPGEYRAALEAVASSAQQSADLISGLLALARADAPRAPQKQPLPLSAVVAEALGLVRARAQQKQVSVSAEVPDGLVLEAERQGLQEALGALLDNAVTWCPPGASLGVSARRADDGVELVVWDTGPGIPPAERPRALERFGRGAAAAGVPGSGLGLAVVDAVLRSHGGALALDTQPGGGLRVVTRWPDGR